jgi:hydroxypyruvate isomerase
MVRAITSAEQLGPRGDPLPPHPPYVEDAPVVSFDRRRFLTGAAALAGASALPHGAHAALAAAADRAIDPEKPGKSCTTQFAVNVEMWFRKMPLLDRIRASAALGFPAVEFWPYENKDIDALAKLGKELGIAYAQFTAWGFSPGMNETKNHDRLVKKVDEACRVAKRLDCKKMCVVGGNDVPGLTQDEMHDNIIAGLKRAAPVAEEHEVMLILEPMNIRVDHKGHCLYGSPKAVRICEEVGSKFVKINWDLYHMHISEGDLCGHLREGWKQVGYLQLADHPGRHEPGTGEIHYNRVLKEAWNLGYRGYVGLECVPTEEKAAALAVAKADIW